MAQRRAGGREIHGILLLDKPSGITSNAALQIVKRLYHARKGGHTGSLDPLATGMLPICLGEATKISGFLLESDKFYRVLVKLGVKTTTGDAEGDVIATHPVKKITGDELNRVLADFTGPIEQVPPMHSAVKQDGQPLYKLAHKGIVVERNPRQVIIRNIKVLGLHDDLLEIDVRCSKGTYVRTLAEDIGERLGCGGHIAALRRLEVGLFDSDKMVTLELLQETAAGGFASLDALLLPIQSAVAQWPDVWLSRDIAYFIKKGQAVVVPHAPSQGYVKLYSGETNFMGIGHILEDGRVAPRRLVNL